MGVHKSKTVFVLGAGFSKPAGAPLQHELIPAILKLEGDFQVRNVADLPKLLNDFRTFLSSDLCLAPEQFEAARLEDVFTPIDRCLQDEVSFRSKSLEDLAPLRENIYSLIVLAIKRALEQSWDRQKYVNSFARYLDRKMQTRIENPHDDPVSVISSNWDILLDNAIYDSLRESSQEASENKAGVVDYCCYLKSLKEKDESKIKPGLLALGRGGYNVKLLKLHGSMNWLQCPQCQRLYVDFDVKLANRLEREPDYCRICIETHKREATKLCSKLIMPTFLKDFRNFQIRLVWQNAAVELSEAEKVVFIGYSLPHADFDLRTLLARSIPTGAKIDLVQPKETKDWTVEHCIREQGRYKGFLGSRVIQPYSGIEEYIENLT